MKVENRVTFDNICDYIPIASTFNSIVDLWQKHAYIKDLKPDADKKFWDDYHVKIINKSTLRSVVLLVPVLGNIFVGIYDLIKQQGVEKRISRNASWCIENDKIDAFYEKYEVFGKKQWEALGFVLGYVPPPPVILKWVLRDTANTPEPRGGILIPGKVNGETLTYERFCNSFGRAFPNTKEGQMWYNVIKDKLEKDQSEGYYVGRAYWDDYYKKKYDAEI
jgi:hypothetical protein